MENVEQKTLAISLSQQAQKFWSATYSRCKYYVSMQSSGVVRMKLRRSSYEAVEYVRT